MIPKYLPCRQLHSKGEDDTTRGAFVCRRRNLSVALRHDSEEAKLSKFFASPELSSSLDELFSTSCPLNDIFSEPYIAHYLSSSLRLPSLHKYSLSYLSLSTFSLSINQQVNHEPCRPISVTDNAATFALSKRLRYPKACNTVRRLLSPSLAHYQWLEFVRL